MKNAIMSHLPQDFPWKDSIICFDTIDSTNTYARHLAANGAPHGTTILADSQTGGRGRMGRSFHSPAGKGIYLSMILRPQSPARELMHLTCAIALAAADGIKAVTGMRPGIKWINDLVIGQRKLGGILTELSVDGSGNAEYAIVGIGINCAQCAEDFPDDIREIATSLRLCTGNDVDRAAIIAAILMSLEKMCAHLHDSDRILARYRRDCITIGQEISVVRGEEIAHGTARNVDKDGGLVVEFSDGRTETVHSGEVSIRGMYGYV